MYMYRYPSQRSPPHTCHGLKKVFVVVYRFIPRHADELELEADDPLLMEMQEEDLWCEAYNMRTGSRGIFPAFYAVKVTKDSQLKGLKKKKNQKKKCILYYFRSGYIF